MSGYLIRVSTSDDVLGYLAESAGRAILVRRSKDATRFPLDSTGADRFKSLANDLNNRRIPLRFSIVA